MQDIIGRELIDGDFAVVAIGRQGGCDMFRGVVYNNYLYYETPVYCNGSSKKSIYKTKGSNLYKIENPTQKEIQLKDSILQKVIADKNKENELKRKKKEANAIRAKDLKKGSFYVAENGTLVQYLGYGTVTKFRSKYGYSLSKNNDYDNYEQNSTPSKEGYIYIEGGYGFLDNNLNIIHKENNNNHWDSGEIKRFLKQVMADTIFDNNFIPHYSVLSNRKRLLALYEENIPPVDYAFTWYDKAQKLKFNIDKNKN